LVVSLFGRRVTTAWEFAPGKKVALVASVRTTVAAPVNAGLLVTVTFRLVLV
jgi:hypothetical protein